MSEPGLGKKPCACKGVRTCLLCEPSSNSLQLDDAPQAGQNKLNYYYCEECEKAFTDETCHPNHSGDGLAFPGVKVYREFITVEEEQEVVAGIEAHPWTLSQSGRRKQDYGPKVNFKKKKLKMDVFTGLPPFSKSVIEKMEKCELLNNLKVAELCNLEYCPERGSAIDPHVDDTWLWGERLVTLNLLSNTFYTMTHREISHKEVKILVPQRSLIVLYGPARYDWMHGITREDVKQRRLATTLRELTPEFLEKGPRASLGQELFDIAYRFTGVPVGVKVNVM